MTPGPRGAQNPLAATIEPLRFEFDIPPWLGAPPKVSIAQSRAETPEPSSKLSVQIAPLVPLKYPSVWTLPRLAQLGQRADLVGCHVLRHP
jgi:hypothetical protein